MWYGACDDMHATVWEKSCCTCPLHPWTVCRGYTYIITERGPTVWMLGNRQGNNTPPHTPSPAHTHYKPNPPSDLSPFPASPTTRVSRGNLQCWRFILLKPEHERQQPAALRRNKGSAECSPAANRLSKKGRPHILNPWRYRSSMWDAIGQGRV